MSRDTNNGSSDDEPTIRTWERVQDVLEDVRADHGRLAQLYDGLRDRTDDHKVLTLLQLSSENARRAEKDLAEYEREMPEKLRRTRIQYRTKRTLPSLLDSIADLERPTVEDVTKIGLQVEGYFEQLFGDLDAMAGANGAMELQEAFRSLRDKKASAKQISARQANSARDV